MEFGNLTLNIDAPVALLTIDRPKALNALCPATLEELNAAVTGLEDDADVKAVILTGAGEKAFVAGGDIGSMQPLDPFAAREAARGAQRLLNRIESGRKIYIAAINGYALGGGCELAMACDIRLASSSARLGQPEINLGIIPGWGGTQRLARLVGKGKAKEIMLTGDMLSAAEAQQIGLVNQVCEPAELLRDARELAEKIAGKSQVATSLIKEAVENGLEMELERALNYEIDLFGLCFASADQKEGMLAFLEKRKAKWQDR